MNFVFSQALFEEDFQTFTLMDLLVSIVYSNFKSMQIHLVEYSSFSHAMQLFFSEYITRVNM